MKRTVISICSLLILASAARAQECEPRWVEGFEEPWFDAPFTDSGPMSALVFDDGTGPALYLGGIFSQVGQLSARSIVRWDGHAWQPLGTGVNLVVSALAAFDEGTGPVLFVGGSFNEAGGISARHVARWDGSAWSALGTGLNHEAKALVVHDDGGGSALYVGGGFTTAGGIPAQRIARWDGSGWSAVGGGFDGEVLALVSWDDGSGPALYAAGWFGNAGGAPASRVARWDGSSWSAVGRGVAPGPVNALLVWDDGRGSALYACGGFQVAGSGPASRIARWDGTRWSALGAGIAGGQAYTMTPHDDGSGPALWVGGEFGVAGGMPAANVARWDGASWSTASPGTDGAVHTLVAFDEGAGPVLLAGGGFTYAGELVVGGCARWDGASWSSVDDAGTGEGDGLAGQAFALQVYDDGLGAGPALHVGGSFCAAGDQPARGVARWDGASWSPLAEGITGGSEYPRVGALCVFDDGLGPHAALFAGGQFQAAGGQPAANIARWDGTSWSPLGAGTGAEVQALAVFDDGSGPALYVGGRFLTAGGLMARHLARWDGAAWSALGDGVDGDVHALLAWNDGSGPTLWVGGTVANAGGVPASGVARWDGTSWSGLPASGMSAVSAFTAYDFGAGLELVAGDIYGRVRRWDGASWSPLGVDLSDGGVEVLGAFDDGSGQVLVAGGYFLSAGGQPLRHLARWDGASWSAFDGGVVGTPPAHVSALAVFADGPRGSPSLYVAGDFSATGPERSRSFARWARACVGTPFCFGDGSGTPCPCGNDGAPGHGCGSSFATGGARLFGAGDAAASEVVLRGEALPPTTTALALRSVAPAGGGLGAPFGDGLLCLDVPLVRLSAGVATNGIVRIALSHGAGPGTFHYQLWYRNSAPFCTAEGFNLTNGLTIVWP